MNTRRSSRSASLLPLGVLLAVSACGGPTTPQSTPATESTTTPAVTTAAPASSVSAAPEAKPTASPSASAAASAAPTTPKAPAGPVHDVDDASGVRRWASYDGPKAGAVITTKKAWVVGPNMSGANDDRRSFRAVALMVADVVKADASEVIFDLHGKKYAVPASLARPAEAQKGLKKGSFALCSFGGNSSIGRIEAVDAKSVTCAVRFLEKTEKQKLPPDEVLALDSKLGLGAPALARFEVDPDIQYAAWVVATEGDWTWVSIDTQFGTGDERVGRQVHKVKTSNTTFIDANKPLKAGDACLAQDLARIMPCKVTKVFDGGVAYVVSFGEGGSGMRKEWEAGTVAPAPAPKADAKKK